LYESFAFILVVSVDDGIFTMYKIGMVLSVYLFSFTLFAAPQVLLDINDLIENSGCDVIALESVQAQISAPASGNLIYDKLGECQKQHSEVQSRGYYQPRLKLNSLTTVSSIEVDVTPPELRNNELLCLFW
tara:strand:- start:439 stop:831 length:393 start_codon:yes stop_codon:yes gene_type:complete